MAGGLGMSDYAAANACLDALAALWQRSAPYPVVSVNWDAWRDLGMAAGRVLPEGIGMDGPEGARALERIVNGPAFAQVARATPDHARP
ncbi:KR domain-containing protein, partial [Variovorax sp. CT11-76]